MTKIEKQMIGVIAVCIILFSLSVVWLSRSIEKAGGVKGIAVSVGKEVKDIKQQIESDGSSR